MSRFLVASTVLLAALLVAACNEQGSVNVANRPANTAANATNSTAATTADHSAEVKKMMGDLAAALNKNDADAVGRFYADDYTIVANGQVQTKAERIEAIRSGQTKFENIAFNDMTVKVYSDTAVTSSLVSGKSWMNGKESSPNLRATSVMVKRPDGWKIVSSHTSEAMAAAGEPKTDAAKPANAAPTDR